MGSHHSCFISFHFSPFLIQPSLLLLQTPLTLQPSSHTIVPLPSLPIHLVPFFNISPPTLSLPILPSSPHPTPPTTRLQSLWSINICQPLDPHLRPPLPPTHPHSPSPIYFIPCPTCLLIFTTLLFHPYVAHLPSPTLTSNSPKLPSCSPTLASCSHTSPSPHSLTFTYPLLESRWVVSNLREHEGESDLERGKLEGEKIDRCIEGVRWMKG